ncbi:MAG: hypothetical protein ACOX0Z_01975 [Candidatus Nanosyncoccaceae bacterium]|jgi:hypothetical protein
MSIKSAVRDRSFVKFLVGGIILLTLTGGGIYLVKKSQPVADSQDDNNMSTQLIDSGGENKDKPMVTVDSDDEAKVSNNSSRPSNSDTLPSDNIDEGSSEVASASGSLPRTGPLNTVSQTFLLGVMVYSVTYIISNRRR